jgi:hypothetical protein
MTETERRKGRAREARAEGRKMHYLGSDALREGRFNRLVSAAHNKNIATNNSQVDEGSNVTSTTRSRRPCPSDILRSAPMASGGKLMTRRMAMLVAAKNQRAGEAAARARAVAQVRGNAKITVSYVL